MFIGLQKIFDFFQRVEKRASWNLRRFPSLAPEVSAGDACVAVAEAAPDAFDDDVHHFRKVLSARRAAPRRRRLTQRAARFSSLRLARRRLLPTPLHAERGNENSLRNFLRLENLDI